MRDSLRGLRTQAWSVVRKALRDSVRPLGLNRPTLSTAIVLTLVALTSRVIRKGWNEVIKGWDSWVHDAVVPISIAILLIVLWNLIHAPNRLKIEALEKEKSAGSWGSGVQRADFAAWKDQTALPLAYAACLLVGVRPEDPPLKDQRAQAMMFELAQAMRWGRLSPVWDQPLEAVLLALGLGPQIVLRGSNLDMRLVSKVELAQYFSHAGHDRLKFLRGVSAPEIESPAGEPHGQQETRAKSA